MSERDCYAVIESGLCDGIFYSAQSGNIISCKQVFHDNGYTAEITQGIFSNRKGIIFNKIEQEMQQ